MREGTRGDQCGRVQGSIRAPLVAYGAARVVIAQRKVNVARRPTERRGASDEAGAREEERRAREVDIVGTVGELLNGATPVTAETDPGTQRHIPPSKRR